MENYTAELKDYLNAVLQCEKTVLILSEIAKLLQNKYDDECNKIDNGLYDYLFVPPPQPIEFEESEIQEIASINREINRKLREMDHHKIAFINHKINREIDFLKRNGFSGKKQFPCDNLIDMIEGELDRNWKFPYM